MAGKILGIDIQSDEIVAVKVEAGLRGYHVTDCASVMRRDFDSLDGALKTLSEQVDFKADTYISAIPGEQASYRNLQMPFRSTKKIRQTIAYEIEPMIPFSIEDLIVDFSLTDQSDRSDILTASVKREYISKYLALLQDYGVDPDILDISGVPIVLWLLRQGEMPDHGILLQIGQKRTTMILYIKRHISLIRSFAFCDDLTLEAISNSPSYSNAQNQAAESIASCFESLCTNVRNTLHAFEYQNNIEVTPDKVFVTGTGNLYHHTMDLLERFLDMPVEEINVVGSDPNIHLDTNIDQSWNFTTMDSALALALRGNKQGLGFNFRKDEFEIRRRDSKLKRDIRKVGFFLIVILSLLITYFGMDYYFLKERYRMLDKQITETFQKTLPDVRKIVDPIQQMRIKTSQIKKSAFLLPGIGEDHKVVDLFRDISLKVPESLDVKVMSMVVDPETVRIKGETDTFNGVDIIKKELEPSEYFSAVTISSANLDRSRKRVQFEIKLKRSK